jgi:hypothetical protein
MRKKLEARLVKYDVMWFSKKASKQASIKTCKADTTHFIFEFQNVGVYGNE